MDGAYFNVSVASGSGPARMDLCCSRGSSATTSAYCSSGVTSCRSDTQRSQTSALAASAFSACCGVPLRCDCVLVGLACRTCQDALLLQRSLPPNEGHARRASVCCACLCTQTSDGSQMPLPVLPAGGAYRWPTVSAARQPRRRRPRSADESRRRGGARRRWSLPVIAACVSFASIVSRFSSPLCAQSCASAGATHRIARPAPAATRWGGGGGVEPYLRGKNVKGAPYGGPPIDLIKFNGRGGKRRISMGVVGNDGRK